jgi:hypothetical protein
MIKKFIQRRQKQILAEIKKAIQQCENTITLEELENKKKPDNPMDVKILIPSIKD